MMQTHLVSSRWTFTGFGMGWVGLGLGLAQLVQMVTGRAACDVANLGIIFATFAGSLGLLITMRFVGRKVSDSNVVPMILPESQGVTNSKANHPALIAALDLLFAHFADDAAAQDAVRVVARAVTEKRFHAEQGK